VPDIYSAEKKHEKEGKGEILEKNPSGKKRKTEGGKKGKGGGVPLSAAPTEAG